MNLTESNVLANASKLNAKMNIEHNLQHEYYKHSVRKICCNPQYYDSWKSETWRLATVNELAFSISICAHITHCKHLWVQVLTAWLNSMVTVLRNTISLLKCHQIHTSYNYMVINVKVCFYYSVRNSYGLGLFSLIVKFVFHWYFWKQ